MRFTILLIISCYSCSTMAAQAVPTWLQSMIHEFKQAPVTNPPIVISQYQLKDKAVYYIPPRCCDMGSALYDADGQYVCSPDGGFTGRGDGRCPGMLPKLHNPIIIWQDPR